MPLYRLSPDPDAPDPPPGHALFLRKPLCQCTGLRIGPGITRSYDLSAIDCPECRTLIETTNALTPPWRREER